MQVDLSSYNNKEYKPGGWFKRMLWHCVNGMFFRSGLFPFYGIKTGLLKLFGARIGKGVLIKPYVNIKYPWFLEIGNHTWVGENVWIDNLCTVKIGSNVCLSQGAYLLTGNHNYKKAGFDLMIRPISIADGVWIGAKAVVCPGVSCATHSILSVGSVANSDLEAFGIYQGNPAVKAGERIIEA